MNINDAQEVISCLDKQFDSHQFIEKFYTIFEKEYVELLYSCIDSKNGIFRAAHSIIGKYLSENSKQLRIEKTNREKSENIKKYDSENQQWRKIL